MGGKAIEKVFTPENRELIERDPEEGQAHLILDTLWFRFYSNRDWHWLFGGKGRRIFCYSRMKIDGKFLSFEYICQRKGGPIKMGRRPFHHRHRYKAKARARERYEAFISSQNGHKV